MTGSMDGVFRALADPTRRELLDSLRREDGQTLGSLCGSLAMTRQSVTQHLAVLADANLISTVRRGREKLHYLNPVPLHDIRLRWLSPFDQPRLDTLAAIKSQAEENDMKPRFVYVTYVHASADRVWHALTDADLTAQYWGHSNVSDWQPGSPWEHVRPDGSGIADAKGTVLAAEPPKRLVMTFDNPDGEQTTVTFLIEPWQDIVRLTVTHEDLPTTDDFDAVSLGWPAVLANLKSLLETGKTLPQAPWEMHAEIRQTQLDPS